MFILSKQSIDLTGGVFGFWVALQPIGKTKHGSILWQCRCKCGAIKSIDGQSLRYGTSKGCRSCRLTGINRTHGETRRGSPSPELNSYNGAKSRCNSLTNHKYSDYGGRGIEFRFDSFKQFLQAVGRKPSPTHTLNRINNNGHYEPCNVEWATPTEQSRNRRNNVLITAHGETKTTIDWATDSGLKFETIVSRIYLYNWCHQCAVTLPVRDGIRQCSHATRR